MWCSVDVVLTDVSEERIASIFRIEGKNKKIHKRRNSESRCKQTVRNKLGYRLNQFKTMRT
jgi:uncharacterized protein (DUF2342 family)